jgi:hypothetical protein
MYLKKNDAAGTIRAVCESLAINQSQLADRIGAKKASITNWKSSGKIPEKQFAKIEALVEGGGQAAKAEPALESVSSRVEPSIHILPLARITALDEIQQRVALDEPTRLEYVEALAGWVNGGDWPFPPFTIFHNGADFILADGFHRHAAAIAIDGTREVPIALHNGTRRDAILYACGANSTHGLRRSPEDKRNAVETLLKDLEWGKLSDRWIAERTHVSHSFVAKVRRELEDGEEVVQPTGRESSQLEHTEPADEPEPKPRKGRDGRVTNTAKIGSTKKPKPSPSVSPAQQAQRAAHLLSGAMSGLRDIEDDLSDTDIFRVCQAFRDSLIHYQPRLDSKDWDAMVEKICAAGSEE